MIYLLRLGLVCVAMGSSQCLYAQENPADPTDALRRWRDNLAADALQRVRLTMVAESWSRVAELPADGEPPHSKTTLNVVRDGRSWRIDEQTVLDNDRASGCTRRETIITDQFLTISGGGPDLTFSELTPKASGKLEVEPIVREAPGYVALARPVFGWGSSDEVALTFPEAMLRAENLTSRRRPDGIQVVTATLEDWTVTAEFDDAAHGFPVAILEKNKTHESRKLDISWESIDGLWIPVRYTIDTSRLRTPEKHSVSKCSVSSFEADISTSDRDLLPTWEIPNGFPVFVDSVPFPCEYRDGRIVPSIVETAGTTNERIGTPCVSWAVGFSALGVVLLVAASIMAYRRSLGSAS